MQLINAIAGNEINCCINSCQCMLFSDFSICCNYLDDEIMRYCRLIQCIKYYLFVICHLIRKGKKYAVLQRHINRVLLLSKSTVGP